MENITAAKEKFGAADWRAQKQRVAAMRAQGDFVDYAAAATRSSLAYAAATASARSLRHEAERVLRFLLKDEVESGHASRSRRSTA